MRYTQPQIGGALLVGGLSNGLIAGINPGSGLIDLAVANRVYSLTGSSPTSGISTFGKTLTVNGAVSSIVTAANYLAFLAGGDYTFIVQVSNIGFIGSNPGVWRSASGIGNDFNIFQGSTGLPWIRINTVDVLRPSSGFAVAPGANSVLGFRVRSATDAAFASDGLIRYSVSHSTPTVGFGVNTFGWQSDTSQSLTGGYSFLAFWNRALSDDEFKAATANPWQLFASPRRILRAAAAGVPTLSAATMSGITSTGGYPQVTRA